MSLWHSFAIARLNLLLQMRDLVSHLLMIAIPLLLTPFLIPGARAQLHAAGYLMATGAEQVVPGFAVLFAFLSTQLVITLFFREYSWGTWNRLRASAARTTDILAGKASVALLIQLTQLSAVIALGMVLFHYRPNGSLIALALVLVTFSVALACMGMLIVSLVDSLDLALSIAVLVGMLMACLGGAIAPVSGFPDWARTAAHISPAYWALEAVERIGLAGATVVDVWPSVAAIALFAIACAVVGTMCFRLNSVKTGIR